MFKYSPWPITIVSILLALVTAVLIWLIISKIISNRKAGRKNTIKSLMWIRPDMQKLKQEYLARLIKIEMEFEIKLFGREDNMDVKFDVAELLRTDKKSQAEYFTKMFNLGVFSPNDIRKELDMEEIDGGDIHVAELAGDGPAAVGKL